MMENYDAIYYLFELYLAASALFKYVHLLRRSIVGLGKFGITKTIVVSAAIVRRLRNGVISLAIIVRGGNLLPWRSCAISSSRMVEAATEATF